MSREIKVIKYITSFLSNSFYKEFTIFSASTIIFQVSRVFVELTVAKIVGPSIWGIWYLLNLIIAYRGIVNCGVDNGMNRQIPILMGQARKQEAILIQNISYSFTLFSSVLVCIVLIIIGLFNYDKEWSKAIIFLAPLFWANQMYYLFSMSLKAIRLFSVLSKMQLLFVLCYVFLGIPLAYIYELNGFIIGYTISMTISFLLIYKVSPIKYSFNLERSKLKDLIIIGFPIMAVGISYTLFNTVDRWIIGIMLGSKELGLYSLSIIIFGGLILLPGVISQQIYPRMAFDWGKSKSIVVLKKWTKRQTKYVSFITIPLVICCYLIIPYFVNLFLPEYKGGIAPSRIIIFGALFLPLSAGWGNVLNIIDKQKYYLIVIIISIIINLILDYLFITNGYGIQGVAFGTVISFALYCTMIMFTGKYFLNEIK